jgi:hypothetical protein
MPDICMCKGTKTEGGDILTCALRADCYRYTATPSKDRQSYFAVAPFMRCGTCEHYEPVTASLPAETKR